MKISCLLFGHSWWNVRASRCELSSMYILELTRRCRRCGKWKTEYSVHKKNEQ